MGDFAIHLANITKEVIAAIPEAAAKGAEHLRQAAVERAPIETGALRTSAEVKAHPDGAEVYFPGPYARYQHYELQLRHEDGQALYLEISTVVEAPKIIEIMAEELRKVIESS